MTVNQMILVGTRNVFTYILMADGMMKTVNLDLGTFAVFKEIGM